MSRILNLLALVLVTTAAAPAAAARDTAVADVQALMAAQETALNAGDIKALEKLYSVDLRFVLETGATATRSELFERFRRDRAAAPALSFAPDRVRPFGTLVQANGTYNLVDPGKRLIKVTTYIAYLERQPSGWKIVRLQFLKAPSPPGR